MRHLIEDLNVVLEGKQIPKITKWVDEWETDDYPYGRFRTTAKWEVEKKGRQMRVARTTINPKTDRANKPKRTTYGASAKIGISDDRAYIVIGGPGQITVFDGAFNHLGAVFTNDPNYKMLAKGLGIDKAKKGGVEVQVKKAKDGAFIDGLQGTETTIRKILTLSGLSETDIADIDNVKRKYKMGVGTLWVAKFKSKRPDYVVTVRD